MKMLTIIPARGGSKGVPRKNVRSFAGKPLIAHTIACAKKAKYPGRVIVSTDSKLIASVARRFGAEVPFLRPKHLASDTSSIVDVVLHLLRELKKQQYEPDYILLLQPTNPLRTVSDINGSVDLILKGSTDAVVTICQTEQLLYTKDKNNMLRLLSNKSFLSSPNRQELAKTYRLDGSMVYVIKTKTFVRNRSFLKGRLAGYEIPRWRAIDIDEPQDFILGEFLFNNFKKIEKKIKRFK